MVGWILSAACARGPTLASPAGVAPPSGESLSAPAGTQVRQVDRLVIRAVAMTLQADSPHVIVPAVTEIVVGAGGYVQQSTSTVGQSAELNVRIPAESLDDSLERIGRLAVVTERRDTGRDVTEEAVDVEARIGSLVVVRDRLRSLVDAAGTIPEILTMERELARVQAEIDSMQARLDLLRSRAALSEVAIRIERPVRLGPLSWLAVGAGRLLSKLFVIW